MSTIESLNNNILHKINALKDIIILYKTTNIDVDNISNFIQTYIEEYSIKSNVILNEYFKCKNNKKLIKFQNDFHIFIKMENFTNKFEKCLELLIDKSNEVDVIKYPAFHNNFNKCVETYRNYSI